MHRRRATVATARPGRSDRLADVARTALEELPLSPAARAELTEALSRHHPRPWPYVMLSVEKARDIQRQIMDGKRPGTTLAVWLASLSYAVYGTGVIEASRRELAELARTTPQEVSRALARLARLEALIKLSRGRYALHPAAAWAGALAARERALATTGKPALTVVE